MLNNKLSLNFMEVKKEIVLLNVEGFSWDFGVPTDSLIPFLHSVFKNDGDLHRVTIKDIYDIVVR